MIRGRTFPLSQRPRRLSGPSASAYRIYSGPSLSTGVHIITFGNLPLLLYGCVLQHINCPEHRLHFIISRHSGYRSSCSVVKLQIQYLLERRHLFALRYINFLLILPVYVIANGSTALCWALAALHSFVILYKVTRTPWSGINQWQGL
jgi:hypothetical protein